MPTHLEVKRFLKTYHVSDAIFTSLLFENKIVFFCALFILITDTFLRFENR